MLCPFCYVLVTTLTPIGSQQVKLVVPSLSKPVVACLLAYVGFAEYCFGEFVCNW